MLSMQPGLPKRRTHDYKRHGTSTLFAALEVATGKVTGACRPRHRHQELLALLKQVARTYFAGELHLLMDNDATNESSAVSAGTGTTVCRFTLKEVSLSDRRRCPSPS